MKVLTTLMALILSIPCSGQLDRIVGKWTANVPSEGAETITYIFHEDQSMDMIYNGNPVLTTKPITYDVRAREHMIELEVQYVKNDEVQQIFGLARFLGDDRMKLELFPFDEQIQDPPKAFTSEVLVFQRQEQ